MFQPTVSPPVIRLTSVSGLLRSGTVGAIPRSFVRFLAASLLGLGLDLCFAWSLVNALHLSLVAATSVSVTAVAAVLYFVHELWTFAEGRRQVSAARMAATVLSAGLTLAVRSICLGLSSTVLGQQAAMLQLATAAGLSFTVNYLVARRLLGRRPACVP